MLTPVELSEVSAVALRSIRARKMKGTFILKNPAFTQVKLVTVFGHNYTAFLVLICKVGVLSYQPAARSVLKLNVLIFLKYLYSLMERASK